MKLNIFHISVGCLYVFLGEMSVQVLCPVFNWSACLLSVELYEFFVYLGYYPLVRAVVCKYHLPVGWLTFYFAVDLFCCVEALHIEI